MIPAHPTVTPPQSGSGRKKQTRSKAAIRNCTHSFAQRVQHQPCRGGQWQVKGVALAVLGNRKGAILPLRMALFPYVPRGVRRGEGRVAVCRATKGPCVPLI